MKVPHTIPKLILKAYSRDLTEDQLKVQYEGRPIRSEDTTWDLDIKETLIQLCLGLVISDYPFYVKLTDEQNTLGKKQYENAEAQWKEDLFTYQKRRKSFERKLMAEEFRRSQKGKPGGVLDDDDYDDDKTTDDPSVVKLAVPQAVPDTFPEYTPIPPVLDRLESLDRMEVIEELDVKEVPFPVALTTIPDVHYWERSALDRWPYADKDEHGKDWIRTYMEMHYREAVENFHPFEGDLKELLEGIDRVAPKVKELTLINLIPNCFGVASRPKIFKPTVHDDELTGEDEGFEFAAELKKAAQAQKEQEEDEPEYMYDESAPPRDNSHLDLSVLMPRLHQLKKLCIIYEMQSMGMEWEARYFDFTDTDVENLAKALSLAPTIEHLELNRSRMTDEQCKVLVGEGLMKMPHLRLLNLSFNNVGNAGARAIAKLLVEGSAKGTLHTLSLARNNIKNKGAKAIAYALTVNKYLAILDLRLNFIGNKGGKDFGHALVKNTSLLSLNLAANRITEDTCYVLGKMLQHNKTLIELDVTSNNLGSKGGEYLAMGVRNNRTILKMDIRLTDSGLRFECDANSHLKQNRANVAYSLVDRNDVYPPEKEISALDEFGGEELEVAEEGMTDEEEMREMTTILSAVLQDKESTEAFPHKGAKSKEPKEQDPDDIF